MSQLFKASALALVVMASPALAQQPASGLSAPVPSTLAPAPVANLATSHLQAARELVVLSGLSNSFSNIFAEFTSSVSQNLVTRPETKKDLDAVLAQLKPEADKRIEDMTNTAARVFANRMSEADLKEVVAFFSSPVGRRYNSTRPQMIDEVYTQLQPWTFRTSDFLYTFTKDEMKKRGHDIGG